MSYDIAWYVIKINILRKSVSFTLQIIEKSVTLQFKMFDMKKKVLLPICIVLLFSSCAQEFNKVYKTDNYQYKYEFAKECYAKGRYTQAITLLTDLINIQKGTDNAQESLYMLAMAEYGSMDYEGAAQAFKRYYQSYPKG